MKLKIKYLITKLNNDNLTKDDIREINNFKNFYFNDKVEDIKELLL